MATKQAEINELIVQVKKLVDTATDLTRQVNRFIRVDNDLAERYARQAEVIDGITFRLDSLEEAINEWFEKASQMIETRLGRLEELALLDRAGYSQSSKAQNLRDTLQVEHDEAHLHRLLIQQHKNLKRLKEREARYGGNAPVDLLNQIDEVEASIAKIREELDAL